MTDLMLQLTTVLDFVSELPMSPPVAYEFLRLAIIIGVSR